MVAEAGAPAGAVALETTLLVHGVPRAQALPLFDDLCAIVRAEGAEPALVGVLDGRPTTRMSRAELSALLASATPVAKANTANLGALMFRGASAATTVSGTMELSAAAGIPVFATGGLGGVHRGYGQHLDISADLAAFTRFPVAVVTSGVKSILDVAATREALEALGVPVVGVGTDRFPAFYLRESAAGVDLRLDDVDDVAAFAAEELARTGRGVVLAHPIPEEHEVAVSDWEVWLAEATTRAQVSGATGRAITPAVLAALVEVSGGATLVANLALVRANARLAAAVRSRMPAR